MAERSPVTGFATVDPNLVPRAPLETVERGYAHLIEHLQGLGAKVAKLP